MEKETYETIMEASRQELVEKIIEKIDALIAKKGNDTKPILIGIDGRCGSGKTTISGLLEAHYAANCFHMDDFYLPLIMRTPERMSQPGGNVHYERFMEEVLSPVLAGAPVNYGTYDCSIQAVVPLRTYLPSEVVIVEGAYALHPTLRDHYDIKLFATHTPECQRARILERNGEKKLYEFELRWIPLEEFYIASCVPDGECDFIIDTSKAW